MAIKSDYNDSRIDAEIQKQQDILYEKILNSFIRAGENFVTQARQQVQDHALGTYEDQTTNLRNSIGYFVFQDGVLMRENTLGVGEIGRSAVMDLVIPKGFQLIGIAGMNYASYVESKGYNVITLQADTCIINLTNYLEILEAIDKTHDTQLAESFATMGGEREEGV